MNQILYKKTGESIGCKNDFDYNYKNRKKFLLVIVFAILLIIIAISFYIFLKYRLFQNEKISKSLVSNYNIMTLYSNSISNYSVEKKVNENKSEPFIIGLIQIDKIKITYPILSSTNDDLLKISPCRFAGPMPNEMGNLCIAGHNYVDNKLFSKLHLLDINDYIKIYDLSGKSLEYIIYDIREINYNDLSCTNQETNNLKIVTLITCNNVTGNRLCITAQEIQ